MYVKSIVVSLQCKQKQKDMIYCLIKGKESRVQHTHPNNQGIITTFLYRGKGNVSARSFSTKDYKSVEDFLIHEYGAKIIR